MKKNHRAAIEDLLNRLSTVEGTNRFFCENVTVAEKAVLDDAATELRGTGTTEDEQHSSLTELLARLAQGENQFEQDEVNALWQLVDPARKPPTVPPPPSRIDAMRHLAELRRQVAAPTDMTLGLDFGTSMSKAHALSNRGNEPTHVVLPLGSLAHRLSGLAGEPSSEYALRSCLWITEQGQVHLGARAEALSADAFVAGHGHRLLDNIKREFVKGNLNAPFDQQFIDDVYYAKTYIKTTRLSREDVLLLYLAYFNRLAERALIERGHSAHMMRRFTLPSFPLAQRAHATELLTNYLAMAQVLSDYFGEKLFQPSGIAIEELVSANRALRQMTTDTPSVLPTNLLIGGITEPVAAAGSREVPEGHEGVVLIIDVGAGTTDFALFAAKGGKLYAMGEQFTEFAGNHVDEVLRTELLRRVESRGIPKDGQAYETASMWLRLNVRSVKETLFRYGRVDLDRPDLLNGMTMTLAEFEQLDGIRQFEKSLQQTLQALANDLNNDRRGFIKTRELLGIRVIFTGGGATLPMVRNLASGHQLRIGSTNLDCKRESLVPPIFSADLREAYPQLAVAIGAATGSVKQGSDLFPDTLKKEKI